MNHYRGIQISITLLLISFFILVPFSASSISETTGVSLQYSKESSEPLLQGISLKNGLPARWDWRDVDGHDWTTPIKDQLQDVCGSCWAFGSLGGLEAAVKLWANDSELDVDLSEQYMVSCSPGSCNGWYWWSTLQWIKNHGAIPESCFPYQADDSIPCESKCEDWRDYLIGVEDYKKVPVNVTAIQAALVEYGPLPASMTVYEDFYPNYTGGVYRYTYGDLVFGHCITIVGYDNTWGGDDEGYWICKNSWGTAWGEDGWFRIAYGECDMEKGVYYYTGPNDAPAKPEPPVGPPRGGTYQQLTFSAVSSDPDGDTLRYCFDWGEGNTSWSTYFPSGEPVQMSYSWRERDSYEIRVKVKDEHGLESDWSDPLPLRIAKSRPFSWQDQGLFYRLFLHHPFIAKILSW
jgi:hypothetical protein